MGTQAGALGGRRAAQAALGIGVSAALLAVARSNYLLFHGLAEGFSIVVALSIFTIAWSARRYMEHAFLFVLGVAALFSGFLDLLHSLAFPGMPVFAGPGDAAPQLWIAARALFATSLLAAFAFVPVRREPDRWVLLGAFAAVTALAVASIFRWRIFPPCYVPGVGQTAFKVAAEWGIVSLLVAALVLLGAARRRFAPAVLHAVAASVVLAIAAEISLTRWVAPDGASNLAGHLLKLLSWVALYLAVVETCVERPNELVFRELATANVRLEAEIATRRETERAKDVAIGDLHAALEELRSLRGIIPICSHCRKIRDDRGAWSQLEAYFHRHAGSQFSHGLCPECLARYYPDVPNAGDRGEPGPR